MLLVAAAGAWGIDRLLRLTNPSTRPFVPAAPDGRLSEAEYEQILELLDVGEPRALELAEAALWQNLADPIASRRVLVSSLRQRTSPQLWYHQDGARRLVPRLLARFAAGVEEARADRLLRALLRVHGQETLRAAGGPLLARVGGLEPTDQVEVLLDPASLRDGYLLYQLEQKGTPAGAVVELALIAILERELPATVRERVIRILTRAPERRLYRLAKLRRVDRGSPAARRLQDLVALCAPATPIVPSLREWLALDEADLRRHDGAFAAALAGSDRALQCQVLKRLGSDPRPRLDEAVQSLAAGSVDPEVRRAALAALAGIPEARSVRTLVAALDDEQWVEPAYAALHFLSGEDDGGYRGAWDFSQSPVGAALTRARWRDRAESARTWSASRRLEPSIRSGSLDALDRRAAYLLARRGERDLDWYREHGRRLVSGLDSPDPRVRTLTVKTIAHWETPEVAPILTERYLAEDDPRVRAVLHDALISVGGAEAVPAVIRTLTRSDAYRGLELVRTYRSLFPGIDLLSAISRHAYDGTPLERAGAAYLLAALPPSAHHARPLLRLLRDPEPLPRFWAQRSLRRLYGTETTYDPNLPPADNKDAILRWHDIVTRSSP